MPFGDAKAPLLALICKFEKQICLGLIVFA
jgi:hypothetical protein